MLQKELRLGGGSYNYAYINSEWGDLLASHLGRPIYYDEMGNPTVYYDGSVFTWTGRQLTSATNGSNSYSFTYNDEGIRTSKTKNGITTTYYLNGSQIIGEETNGNITLYIYDESGSPIGMQCLDEGDAPNLGLVYWFEKNLQGDVIAVYNAFGDKVVTYTYDAWGNATVNLLYTGDNYATQNPFRYRGYYYDDNLGLYYLNSRYYDSYTGRFINADSVSYLGANGDLVSYNLYAYCSNNFITDVDPCGKWAVSIGFVFSAYIFSGVSYGIYFSFDDDGNVGIQSSEANVFNKASGVVIGPAAISLDLSGGLSPDADTIYDLEGETFSAAILAIQASTSDLNNVADGVNMFTLNKNLWSFGHSEVCFVSSKTETLWSMNLFE